jgi:hypothetical protein
MFPVYYKTLAFMRGEQFVTLFTLLVIYELMRTLSESYQPSWWDVVKIGFGVGLMLLSRQWAGFVIMAIGAWVVLLLIRRGRDAIPFARMSLIAAIIGAVIGGGFYLSLYIRYGSFFSFNRTPKESLTVPADFFTGLGDGKLFTSPYGLAFPGQFIPKFYTEIWGDYEGYFFLPHDVPVTPDLLAYVGRVNAFALIPSAIFLLSLILGLTYFVRFLIRYEPVVAGYALVFTVIAVSCVGYLWFVVGYPNITGDTIKATYTLQIFPLLAILGGELLIRVNNRNVKLYQFILFLLALSFIHNIPVLFTRHINL